MKWSEKSWWKWRWEAEENIRHHLKDWDKWGENNDQVGKRAWRPGQFIPKKVLLSNPGADLGPCQEKFSSDPGRQDAENANRQNKDRNKNCVRRVDGESAICEMKGGPRNSSRWGVHEWNWEQKLGKTTLLYGGQPSGLLDRSRLDRRICDRPVKIKIIGHLFSNIWLAHWTF